MQLIVEPDSSGMRWKEFIETKPRYSIALDGYVAEGPRLKLSGPWQNFNHHEGVSRLETRATCAQVLIALQQGLMDTFDPASVRIFVNDCDEDVSLSVFLLKQHKIATARASFRLNRLVEMEDKMDTTGGAYPYPEDMQSLHELLWVFEPYHFFRSSGELNKRKADSFAGVIDEVGKRTFAYMAGCAKTIKPDTRFECLENHMDWTAVKEIGANARLGFYNAGINAFLSVRDGERGMHHYTLGRKSLYIPFPIPKLLKRLNEAEIGQWAGMLEAMPEDEWGGGDMIAGSPRMGSLLKPNHVADVINRTLR